MFQFRQITLNLVYFLNVLLVFLLVFEDKVQLPVFLQVTGRIHPLSLHFPLVLLFLGVFLEWLTTRKKFRHPATIEITRYVFYFFALGAAFTAVFGFFLYQEGAYQGEEALLHKWMGTAVSILAISIVWLKERSTVLYYATLGVSALCLTVTGHLGAEITHGKGFLTEPIRKHWQAKKIAIEHVDSAVVFRDVIQPIMNEKCLSCHNANKAKNDLILTDYQSIMKGGENADVIVAGKAEESLMYQYALLPMDDSLHMPPGEKLQLDQEEIKLIGWWINTGAKADLQYVKMAKVDSIHTIMLSKFKPKTGLDLIDISFADQQEINDLNNPYRTVRQISATKPYIAVFLGSKKDFTSKDLTELKPIAKQVVSIDMGNSKVSDADLKNLSQFPHLQKLHLQNMAIGDEGVKQLRGLHYLDVLNISGTKISGKTLDEVAGWKNLKKLYLYNTAVQEESVKSLKNTHPELQVYSTQFDLSDSVYNAQLTPPVCKIDSTFFHNTAFIELKLSRGKVKYYYTLDGTEPTSKANLYTGPFQIDQTCELRIFAAMDGWISSQVVSFPLLKLGGKPDRVILETNPDPKYTGQLDSMLVDGKSGSLNLRDKEYLGFGNQHLHVLFEMDQPRRLSQVTVSYLEDPGKGVLAPEYIEVWGGEDKNRLLKLGMVNTDLPKHNRPAAKGLIKINFPEQAVNFVRLKAKNRGPLPAWHPQKKSMKASILVDEIALE